MYNIDLFCFVSPRGWLLAMPKAFRSTEDSKTWVWIPREPKPVKRPFLEQRDQSTFIKT